MSDISSRPNIGQMVIGIQRREAIVACVREFITEHGYSPIAREIGERLDMGTRSVWHHLNILIGDGRIQRAKESGRHRAVWIPGLEPPEPPQPVPIFCSRCGLLANLEQNAHGDWLCPYCDGRLPRYYWHAVADSAGFAGKTPTRGRINGV